MRALSRCTVVLCVRLCSSCPHSRVVSPVVVWRFRLSFGRCRMARVSWCGTVCFGFMIVNYDCVLHRGALCSDCPFWALPPVMLRVGLLGCFPPISGPFPQPQWAWCCLCLCSCAAGFLCFGHVMRRLSAVALCIRGIAAFALCLHLAFVQIARARGLCYFSFWTFWVFCLMAFSIAPV